MAPIQRAAKPRENGRRRPPTRRRKRLGSPHYRRALRRRAQSERSGQRQRSNPPILQRVLVCSPQRSQGPVSGGSSCSGSDQLAVDPKPAISSRLTRELPPLCRKALRTASTSWWRTSRFSFEIFLRRWNSAMASAWLVGGVKETPRSSAIVGRSRSRRGEGGLRSCVVLVMPRQQQAGGARREPRGGGLLGGQGMTSTTPRAGGGEADRSRAPTRKARSLTVRDRADRTT